MYSFDAVNTSEAVMKTVIFCFKNTNDVKKPHKSRAGRKKLGGFQAPGEVSFSSAARYCIASSRQAPHISGEGCSEAQTAGRSGESNIRQRISLSRFTQGVPAGLPSGIPGIAEDIDGAMQQAPHRALHLKSFILISPFLPYEK